MSDRFGIPDSMTGDLGEDFYALIGRIVVLTTLIELKVQNLAAALGKDETQETFARMSVIEHAAYCRAHLPANPAVAVEVERYLGRVEVLRKFRSGLVHSMWPTPEYGWRPPQQKKRRPEEDDNHYLISTRTTAAAMQGHLTEVVALVEAGSRLTNLAGIPAPPALEALP